MFKEIQTIYLDSAAMMNEIHSGVSLGKKDSEYYRDDPRAQEYGHTGIDSPSYTPVSESTPEETVTEPSQTMADPVKDAEEKTNKLKSESQSADFAEATTVNMWDNIRTDNGGSDDDSDIPAILRRRKKNKD